MKGTGFFNSVLNSRTKATALAGLTGAGIGAGIGYGSSDRDNSTSGAIVGSGAGALIGAAGMLASHGRLEKMIEGRWGGGNINGTLFTTAESLRGIKLSNGELPSEMSQERFKSFMREGRYYSGKDLMPGANTGDVTPENLSGNGFFLLNFSGKTNRNAFKYKTTSWFSDSFNKNENIKLGNFRKINDAKVAENMIQII